MKLSRLKVEQLRQFRDPVEIRDLEDGINLFTGPNESGKSTLVRAIRAAFFERHKSSSVDDLQPWGDSSAAPTIELEFEWQQKHWKVIKSFLKKKRCDVTVEGDAFSGDEADGKLAELLGFELPGRGASRPENWGIPGLLWIEQGAGQEIKQPVEDAGQHLKSALGANLGEVASSKGDELLNRVAKERSKLLTATGWETGDYARAIEEHNELERQHAELQSRVQQYRQQVDRLGQLRDEQEKADVERVWESYRAQAQQAETKLNEVTGWQKAQEHDQQALRDLESSIQTTRDLLSRFEEQQKDLQKRQAERQAAEQKLAELEARKPATESTVVVAREAFESARAAVKLARQHQEHKDLSRELAQVEEDIASIDGKLARARELHARLIEQKQKQQSLQVDSKSHKRLKKVEEELTNLAIKQEAIATRLQFELTDDQAVMLGGEALGGQGERLLLEPTEMTIAGVGTLRILPGGEDIADLVRNRQTLLDEQASLLSRLGVSSLADADSRLEQSRELEQGIKNDELLLKELAPEGLDALLASKQLKQTRKDDLAPLIAKLPVPENGGISVSRAEVQQEGAEESLKSAEAASQELRSDISLARQALDSATSEWQRLSRELQAPDRKQLQKGAEDRLIEQRAQARRLEETVADRQKQIEQANPDVLRQDIERFTRSAEAAEKEYGQRRLDLERLKASLEAIGAEGLEEQSAELAATLERSAKRRAELELRAKALDLLHRKLTDHRLTLTRQLQEPLQRHLNRYLQLLFPDARLTVDENLVPEVLIRHSHGAEERGRFEDLSFGAREQMALISRLAYADLLLEVGRPTLIILDDALVHSDAERLKAMKRVLFDAGQRHQILLFSCHPDNWRDLGVVARTLPELTAGGLVSRA